MADCLQSVKFSLVIKSEMDKYLKLKAGCGVRLMKTANLED